MDKNYKKSICRIITTIDTKIDRVYSYNEEYLSLVTVKYIKKYLKMNPKYPRNKLILLCATSYLIAIKYLLDTYPLMSDYSKIVNIDSKKIVDQELKIAKDFLFNFTPGY